MTAGCRAALAAVAVFVACLDVFAQAPTPSQQTKPELMKGEELFAEYLATGPAVLAKAFPTNQRFVSFGGDFRNRVLTDWERVPPTRPRAMFMLDVSIAALNRGYPDWLDFIHHAGKYLRRRPEPPGVDPAADAFELLWYKTAVSVISGQRRPDFLAKEGIAPLASRVAPAPVEGGAPVLVDPWIALARGFSEEAFAIERPPLLDKHGTAAVAHYGEAARYESTRAEATLRAAWVLLRMKRAADALARLDTFDGNWTNDGVLHYWRWLFRGKALEALGRGDDAKAAYRDALEIAPTAQSPRVALMAIDLNQGDREAADRMAAEIRTADPVIDPWWSYAHGDLRFFTSRLTTLREMSR